MYILVGCINYLLNMSVTLNVNMTFNITVLALETLLDCHCDYSQKQLEVVLNITQTTSWCPLRQWMMRVFFIRETNLMAIFNLYFAYM